MSRFGVGLLALAIAPACENDGSNAPEIPDCVELDLGCAPLYEPTFDNVFTMTLQATCGVPGSACHGAPDAMGAAHGLVMQDIDAAYDLLVDATHEPRPYVEPGDAACSLVAVRLGTNDPDIRMPPGQTPLDERARCSITLWIENGAAR